MPGGNESASQGPARQPDPALEHALAAARSALDSRAQDVVVLDMRELTSMFDYFVMATGTSRRQLHAISDEIDRVLEDELGQRRLGVEGYQESRWILLDYGDVVIHLFDPDTRAYYALEELWAHARRVPFPDNNGSDSSATGQRDAAG